MRRILTSFIAIALIFSVPINFYTRTGMQSNSIELVSILPVNDFRACDEPSLRWSNENDLNVKHKSKPIGSGVKQIYSNKPKIRLTNYPLNEVV